MIVCHTHRFVFLKTHKAAGTSIEIELARLCGPADTITPLLPPDEEIRGALGRPGEQNTTVPIRRHTMDDIARLITRRQRATYTPFLPAERARSYIGQLMWRSYFTFAIERNPFDTAISLHHSLGHQRQQYGSIDDWIATRPPDLSNWPIYARGDRVIIDHVGRYDDLPATFAQLSEHIGIEVEAPVVRSGAEASTSRPPSQVLNPASQEIISQVCAREIARFGYRCD